MQSLLLISTNSQKSVIFQSSICVGSEEIKHSHLEILTFKTSGQHGIRISDMQTSFPKSKMCMQYSSVEFCVERNRIIRSFPEFNK